MESNLKTYMVKYIESDSIDALIFHFSQTRVLI